jgi:hypothetical protein
MQFGQLNTGKDAITGRCKVVCMLGDGNACITVIRKSKKSC